MARVIPRSSGDATASRPRPRARRRPPATCSGCGAVSATTGGALQLARRGRSRRTGLRRRLPADDRRPAAPAGRRAVHRAGDPGVRLRGRRGHRRHQRRSDLGPLVGTRAAARGGPGAGRRRGPRGRGLGLEPVPARRRRHRVPGPRAAVREVPVGAVVLVVGGRMPGARSRVGVGAHQPAAVALRRAPTARDGVAWSGPRTRSGPRRPPGRDHGLARRRGPARARVAAGVVADGLAVQAPGASYRLP